MQIMVDFAINDNCWNFYESYGEICIGCGCCSKDKATRYKARYEVCQSMIEDQLSFDGWFDEPELRALQEKNIKLNLNHFRRLSRYYKKKLEGLKNGETRTVGTPINASITVERKGGIDQAEDT